MDQIVEVTDLDHPSDPTIGKIGSFSDQGLRVIIDRKLAVGASVKIEWPDTLVLGTVISCVPHYEQLAIRVEVTHMVHTT